MEVSLWADAQDGRNLPQDIARSLVQAYFEGEPPVRAHAGEVLYRLYGWVVKFKADRYAVSLAEEFPLFWHRYKGELLRDQDLSQEVWLHVLEGSRLNAERAYSNNRSPLRKWLEEPTWQNWPLYNFIFYHAQSYLSDLARVARRSLRQISMTQEFISHIPDQSSVLTMEARALLQRCIFRCLESLNPRDQRILKAKMLGLSPTEAAQNLGLSQTAYNAALSRARERFHERLLQECPEFLQGLLPD